MEALRVVITGHYALNCFNLGQRSYIDRKSSINIIQRRAKRTLLQDCSPTASCAETTGDKVSSPDRKY